MSTNNFNITPAFSIIGRNIVKDKLLIRINQTTLNNTFITIYNSLGQKIITYKVQNINLLPLNVSHLSNGIYYVVASNPDSKPLKFIKSN